MKNDNNIYKIHCYKHNGKIHRIWDKAKLIAENDDYIVCGNFKTKVIESDGRSYNTKEPAIIFFYKKRWFNVIAQFKKYGLFYYCNIASPYIIEENTIKYIDYDLDLRVFPDGGYRVLDKNEYKYHKKIMNYSDEIDYILHKELEELIRLKSNNIGPFNKNLVQKYLDEFMKK